jgi:hypothetical protein
MINALRWRNSPPAFLPKLNVLERSLLLIKLQKSRGLNTEGPTTVQITPKAVIEETPTDTRF